MTEGKLKHLEFIQNVITRMNSNSFQLKEWTIVIISAILALYASTKNPCFIIIGVFPAFIFWALDAYYLMQERKFRGLYNDVAGVTEKQVTEKQKDIKPFEMRPDLYIKGKYSYLRVLFSETIWTLYLPIIIILISGYLYMNNFN